MIVEEKCYGYECDGCGKLLENFEGVSFYVDKDTLEGNMDDEEWTEINGKWYCPECVEKLFVEDEETGEYKLKRKEE